MLFASSFVQALAEFAVLLFYLGQATNQALVLPLEGLPFLSQYGQASAQVQEFPVTFLATGTQGMARGHGDLHQLGSGRGRRVIEGVQPSCSPIVWAGSRSRGGRGKGCLPGRERT
jgi:hypothetical protein